MNTARLEMPLDITAAERPPTDDIRLAVVAAAIHLVLIAIGALLVPLPFLQVPIGLALLLFVPGYFMTATFLPRRTDVTIPERFGLSIALSLAVVAVLAAVLDALRVGLQPRSLAIAVYAVWAVFAIGAILRRWRLPPGTAVGRIDWRPNPWWDGLDGRDRAAYSIVLTAMPALFAVGIAFFVAPPSDRTMTEFYVVGDRGMIGGYPYSATPSGDVELTVGVANREASSREYRIEAWQRTPESEPMRLSASDVFELRPGEVSERPITLRLKTPGPRQEVDLRLLEGTDPQPYRELTLWIDVPGRGGAAGNSSPAGAIPSSTAS